jgi:hypothetical protein
LSKVISYSPNYRAQYMPGPELLPANNSAVTIESKFRPNAARIRFLVKPMLGVSDSSGRTERMSVSNYAGRFDDAAYEL